MPRPALALITCFGLLAGCSLSISAPSASRKKHEPPVCDSGKGLVALDALMAVGLGVGGLAAISEDESSGAIALVGAALFSAAALHGSSNADKCRAAFDRYAKDTAGAIDDDELAIRRARRRRRRVDPSDDPPPQPAAPVAAPVPVPVPVPAPAPQPVGVDRTANDPPPQPPPSKPAKAPKQPARIDDWSEFWREVTP